jgi:CrcB protein
MILAILVAAAAAVGAAGRYLLTQLVQHWHDSALPWGTFAVNVSGSLLLGLVTGLSLHHGLPARPFTVIGVGFIGGYTTWSTFVWESVAFAESGAWRPAVLNLLGSLAVGLAAASAGLALALL